MEQKKALDAHFQKVARRVHVASLGSVDNDEHFGTVTVWGDYDRTLLPRADSVVVAGKRRDDHIIRRWEDVEAICGPWPVEPGTYPPRYFVERGPSQQEWESLKAFELPDWMPGVRRAV